MVVDPGRFIQERVNDLETRVAYLESVLTAMTRLATYVAMRRHAPAEIGDLIEEFRLHREKEDIPPEPPPVEGT